MLSNGYAMAFFPRKRSGNIQESVIEIYTCVRDWDEPGTLVFSAVNRSTGVNGRRMVCGAVKTRGHFKENLKPRVLHPR